MQSVLARGLSLAAKVPRRYFPFLTSGLGVRALGDNVRRFARKSYVRMVGTPDNLLIAGLGKYHIYVLVILGKRLQFFPVKAI